MSTLVHQRVEAARGGINPTVICQMASGWAVLGDRQYLPGYALLLPDPVVTSLNCLDREDRARYLLDMAALGDALLQATSAMRINYAIYGNHDAALHAHLFPLIRAIRATPRLCRLACIPRLMRMQSSPS